MCCLLTLCCVDVYADTDAKSGHIHSNPSVTQYIVMPYKERLHFVIKNLDRIAAVLNMPRGLPGLIGLAGFKYHKLKCIY